LKELDVFLRENKILEKKFAFITCGDWDLKIMLKNETTEKKIEVP
jgi:ERI1 exoribonuclease 3